MRISARTNIQQQSQETWGRRVKKKHNPERTRADDLWDISRQPSILGGVTLAWGQSATDVTVPL